MLGVPDDVMAVLAKAGGAKAFADWLSAGAVPPEPSVGVPVLAPADTRPRALPEWSPWVAGAYVAVLNEKPPLALQWWPRTDASKLREAVRAAIAAVGLAADEPTFPPGLLPMSIAMCTLPGATDKTGRLVAVVYGVYSGDVGVIASALVRP